MAGCTVAAESQWGPSVDFECLNGFDFTLLFEESILTILPIGVFLLLAPLRSLQILQRPKYVRKGWLLPVKLTVYGIYIVLQATQIGLYGEFLSLVTPTTLATCVLTLCGYFAFAALSFVEHERSLRPSTLLNLYLGLTLLLDMARVRTLWLVSPERSIPSVVLAAYCVKIVLLALESTEKRALLRPEHADASREDLAGIFNRLNFAWLNPIFVRGFKKILSLESLMDIDQDLIDSSDPVALKRRWARANRSRKHSLLWTFAWHYRWTVLSGVPPKLAWTGLQFAQPFLIQRVLDFLDQPQDMINRNSIAYGLIGGYAAVYIGIAFSYAFTEHKTDRIVIKFRGSLIALIFEKTLRMEASAVADASALTLMSADVDRVANGLRYFHDVWSAFIEAALALWLLERLLGVAVVGPALFTAFILGIGLPLGNMAGNAQGLWLEAIEERLAVTSKALRSFRGIKMTGAVSTARSVITKLREREIAQSGKYRWYTALVITVAYLSDSFAPVLGFGTYIILAEFRDTQTLTQGTAFASLTLFSLLSTPMSILISGAEELKTVVNCFERIQAHLNADERVDSRTLSLSDSDGSNRSSQSTLTEKLALTDGATFNPDSKFDSNEKSTPLDLDTLLSTQDLGAGYDSKKSPVVESVTLKLRAHAITMVVGPVGCGKSTLLASLLAETPHMTGSVTASFARAAYCPQTPWIRSGSIRTNILGESIWDAKRYAAVTAACALDADFAHLPNGDQTKAGAGGARLSGGQARRVALARALYANTSALVLDNVLAGLDRRTEQAVLDGVFASDGLLASRGAGTVLATSEAGHLPYADWIIVLSAEGRIAQQGSYEELTAAGGYVSALTASSGQADQTNEDMPPPAEALAEATQEVEQAEQAAQDEARRTGDLRVYWYYFKAAGLWTMGLFLATCCVFVFGITFPTVWVQWWSLANDEHGTQRVGYWLGVYAALGAISVIATFCGSFLLLMVIVPGTARRLHGALLKTVGGATAGWLATTETGTTTNRFAQDLELVDLDLPSVFETTVLSALACVAEAVLVFTGSGYVAAALPGVFVVVYLIQNMYLRTSRQLRLLDIEARAPLFGTFLELLTGLASVRAFGWQEAYTARARRVLDASQKPYYLLFTAQRWLTLVLQLVVAGVAILLVALATTTSGSYTYLLGAALFNIVSFGGTLEQVITDWTQLEQSIGAVARIRSFVNSTPREDEDEDDGDDVPESWPEDGSVTITDLSASYTPDEPILRDVSLSIKTGEKVGICGRTGSGKSSLIATLLRMLDASSGSITISDRDVTTVCRTTLRERINTLPQDPFFLHGSVRLNADPQGVAASDGAIVAALEAVGLWGIWKEDGGLDAHLDEEVLSHGQRQLFCLARAMCKPCRILVLDEASSSVDAETDEQMQRLIRDHFKTQTVIAVAHKLQAMVDYDKVVVLDRGRLVECGRPSELLEHEGSAFKSLYESLHYTS